MLGGGGVAFISVGHSYINALTLHIALSLCLRRLAVKNNVSVA
jgi:hypothetical protein